MPKFPSRRQFIKGAGLVGAASVLATQLVSAEVVRAPVQTGDLAKAKNLIFLVVDGMCTGALGLAHHWSLRNREQVLNWMRLYERKDLVRAVQDTASASSPVTDSAAASSAWGSGHRVNNGSINFAPDGRLLTPLWTHAKNAGKATGLVTTCRITHATPAGFATNVRNRGMEDEIARQYFERGVDVLLGGGAQHFLGGAAPDADRISAGDQDATRDINLISGFEAQGYNIVRSKQALAEAAGCSRLLGLFAESHIPYAIDRQNDPSLGDVPGLAEMFRAALKSLGAAKNGFVLQVEGGRVDHAAHANDPAAILHELLEFDACIPIALEYLESHPDTLLVITTDHGTGGCQLNGMGDAYAESGPALDRINQIKYSFEWLQERFMRSGVFSPVVFKMATGIELSEKQSAKIQQAINQRVEYLSNTMTDAVSRELWSMTAIGWTSQNHTSECVDLLAFGAGAQSVPPFLKNNEMFGLMVDALGLEVQRNGST